MPPFLAASFMFRFATYLLLSCLTISSFSQEFDVFITDTVMIEGDSVLVFSDNSWQFINKIPNAEDFLPKNESYDVIDTNWLFNTNWNNNRTHRNLINLAGMKDSIVIPLFPFDSIFTIPMSGTLSSRFKFRWGKWHKGIDIAAPVGTPVYASFSGKVRYAKMNGGGYGNLVIIRHYNGLETYYAHLDKYIVEPNQYVKAGQIIGYCGNTGKSTGSHLHFETRFIENSFNPEIIINFPLGKVNNSSITIKKNYFNYKQMAKNPVYIDDVINKSQEQKTQEKPKKKRRTGIGYYGNM